MTSFLQRSQCILCAAIVIVGALLVLTPARDLRPATHEELSKAVGGDHCTDCTNRVADCGSVSCTPDIWSGGSFFIDGSERETEHYCIGGLATGFGACADGYSTFTLVDCQEYFYCTDTDCDECDPGQLDRISGSCAAGQACEHGET